MNSYARIALCFAAGLLLATSVSAQFAPVGRKLGEEELRALYSKDLVIEIVDTIALSTNKAIIRANGTITIEWRFLIDGTRGTDEAKWHLEGDTFCERWNFIFNGQETCFRTYQGGPAAYNKWTVDGKYHAFWRPAGK